MRNPKIDPRPGDELRGPRLKTKVVSITLNTSGVETVCHEIADLNAEYDGRGFTHRTFNDWKHCVGNDLIVVTKVAGEEPKTETYGHPNTWHQSGEVNVETSADGRVVSVWFRCMPLPFDQTIVGKERAADMVRMYGEIDKRNIVAVEVADLGGR